MRLSTIGNTRTIKAALLASVIGLAPTASAFAQTGEDQAGEPKDEIIVTASPIRDSQAAALRQKRNADNVVDVISADTIGRFPDQNLADSLGRVPGLAIERDQGQARFINFRGAPFRFTAIAFDGIDVPGAENGRIPRFDAFPAAITSAIEVNKAITPDMPGEAVAGFVDIKTFSPFDREGFHISMEGGYGEQELGNVGIERVNGRISYSNDTFGVLIFGSHNKRGRITDNREYELEIDPATGGVIPNNLDFRSYRGEREDNAWGGALEFRPADNVRIFGSSIFSEFIDREERNQFDFDITDGLEIALGDGAAPTPDVGYAPVVLVQRLLEDGLYTNSTFINTLGAEFDAGGWDMALRGNYTKTKNSTFLPLPLSAGGAVAASYDVTDILNPQITLFEAGTMTPTTLSDIDYAANLGIIFAQRLDIENYKIKFDAERDLDLFGLASTVKTGFQVDLRDASGGSVTNFGGFPSSVDIASFDTGVPWDTDFDNTIGGTNFDNIGLRQAWEDAVGSLELPFEDENIIGIDENIYALYAMNTTEFNWGNIVFGGRLEITDFTSSGSLVTDTGVNQIEVDNNYVHFLPSAHLNVDITDDIKFRLSGTTGVSRPTYTEARASISVDPVELEITGGNPELDAEFAYGGDVALEYYFADASIISVGGFVRFIDNVLYADGTTIADGASVAPGVIAPGTPTVFNSFFNGDDGKLYGLEASFIGQATFLPEPFDGFGATANVTILDSEFTAPTQNNAKFDLPGTSDIVFNASIYYEKFGLSARVNYQYRDQWLSTTENDGLNEFWDDTERVDASIRYTLPVQPGGVNVTLFADGNNLTNERDLRFENTRATPNQYEGFGRRYVFGARIDY